MDNIYIIAGIISFIFMVCKFIEMRYIEKEIKPLKELIRDALLVYFSVISGNFIVEQLKPVINNVDITSQPLIFTGNPDF